MARLPIPCARNAALVVVVACAMVGLLACARVVDGAALAACAVAYALVFQTCFALFHEAAHLKLHARFNGALGVVVGTLFGMSSTMFAITHWSHHLKNRADEEAYDQVAPGESYARKAIGWYGMLLSLWYWAIWPMNVLIVVAPSAARAIAARVRIADAVWAAPPSTLWRIRAELAVWLAWVIAVGVVVGPHALVLQAAGAWLWSSSNYVEHAFAPRDVVTGAFNLRAPIYGSINLHRELDRTHHLWPDASWVHLRTLTRDVDGSLWAHWLRQWRGPVHVDRAGPAPVDALAEVPLP